ncbi:MAG: hypothetical protein CVU87_12470 [Firmicutes bacterium HGW-Firmicutes-12]|jgi:hypothetical protein|nr:MAG: hypothetical protein CVU87_12470 [Firmicutes bacterium HGW-Firmicutes-12]
MKKRVIEDRIILTALAGIIAAFIANIFGYLSKIYYPTAIIMPEIAAATWINDSQIHTVPGIIFGNISSFIVGGIHSLIYITLLDKTGWKYFWLKSLIVTTTGWLFALIFLLRILDLQPEALNDIWASILFYGAHFVYLCVSAYIVKTLGVSKKNFVPKK